MIAVIETGRLLLREMGPGDLDAVAAMLGDGEVMRYWPRPHTREEAAQWIERQVGRYARDGCGYWLAVEKATGLAVGQAGIMSTVVGDREEAALGYITARPFWRRGFALEAAAACLGYAFGTLGRREVVALVRPENAPSAALAEKLGMSRGEVVVFHGLRHAVYRLSRPGGEGRR